MSTTAASPLTVVSPPTQPDTKPLIIRRPSLIMKPATSPPNTTPITATSPQATSPNTTLSLTSKEWVIPPRPKPGRKPATDTPPSKRKAQNRAAQRAFRERRAQRVSELEEQLKQVEDENERDEEELRSHITRLESEIERYRSEIVGWAEKCRKLENGLANVRSTPDQDQSRLPVEGDTSVGCGKCTLESRCQCIDEAFDAMGGHPISSTNETTTGPDKRPHSPNLQPQGAKKIKIEAQDSLEIDFTTMYTKARPHTTAPHVSSTPVVTDLCGFCSDGTPCICAEMAAEQDAVASSHIHAPPSLGRSHPSTMSQFTPPPSEGDVAISLPTASSVVGNCASGPGTCAQCRADPNSTLFCKSLAASRAQSQSASTSGAVAASNGCCGGKGTNGGCCQSTPNPSNSNSTISDPTRSVPLPPRTTRSRASRPSTSTSTTATLNTLPPPPPKHPSTSTSKTSITLTCADAYTTLSRHPGYEKASGEIASWMPKLHAADVSAKNSISNNGEIGADTRMEIGSRPAMEIDAANVMAVLKDFDRRFGRNA